MEIYRYLIDDFIIGFCKDLSKKDFTTKTEIMSRGKIGKRRIRQGKRQELETLISEEALLLAKFLRKEKEVWIPRLPSLKTPNA